MATSNHMSPGMTISIKSRLFRVESCVKVTVAKGTPFIKASLKDLLSGDLVEKSFKVNQKVELVTLEEKALEFLYMEGKDYLFLDDETLETLIIPGEVVGLKANFLKEGTEVKGAFYKEKVFSINLPQFLELMVVSAESDDDIPVADATKLAVLETGAKVDVPPFIEVGDIVKVDSIGNEFVQRV